MATEYSVNVSQTNVQASQSTSSVRQVSQERNETQDASGVASGKKISHAVAARQQLNVSILEASAKVSLGSGQQSQALLFRSAVDRINEILAAEGGGINALQTAAANQDNSPEATADRILQMSTGWLQGYMKQHPNEDQEAIAKKFVDVIRTGFEKGYKEATNILEGLKVFQGDIKSGVEKTFDLVQKGLDDFLAKTLASLKPPAAETTAQAANG